MRIEVEPGLRVFVDVEGAGLVPDGPTMREKPTLILLHGGPGFDHTTFKPLFSQLADVAQVVYLDHRGHGRSDRCPPADWTLDTFADDVVRVCDRLGIERPVVLGQSFGGFVAQRYLARHPSHPSRVVLSSTSHHMGLDRKLARFESIGGPEVRAIAEAFWRAPSAATWAPYAERCHGLYNPTPRDDTAARRTTTVPEILFAWSGGEMQTMDLRPGLSAVRCPVLVLAGRDDPVCPVDDAREIADAIPAPWGRLVVMDGCGHGVWRDDPVAGLALLRGFVTGASD